MTRDEVMAMTDKALQIKAAELTGTERAYLCCEDSYCPPTSCLYGDEDVYDCIHLREGGNVDDCREMRRGDLPDYPNDIAAAWGLVENIIKQHKNFALSRDADAWYVEMDWLSGCDVGSLAYCDARAKHDSAPRAITMAFILTMEAEK